MNQLFSKDQPLHDNRLAKDYSGLIFGHFFDKSTQLELAVFEFF